MSIYGQRDTKSMVDKVVSGDQTIKFIYLKE